MAKYDHDLRQTSVKSSSANIAPQLLLVIQAPNRCIHVRKHFVPEGEWTMVPTKKGVTLSMYQWEELKKTIPIFEEKEPELKTLNMC